MHKRLKIISTEDHILVTNLVLSKLSFLVEREEGSLLVDVLGQLFIVEVCAILGVDDSLVLREKIHRQGRSNNNVRTFTELFVVKLNQRGPETDHSCCLEWLFFSCKIVLIFRDT